ncbi:MAG: YqhA family protein [Actinobacteria bacterium]|nr:YqhA family protein [Actinomycetota bacterium]
MSQEKTRDIEEVYVTAIHKAGISLGIFVVATASFLAFVLAFFRLIGTLFFMFSIETGPVLRFLAALGLTGRPIILMLIDIVDAVLVGAILLVLAFGLKSVFTGRRYRVISFGIKDIDELKEYLVGLIITLLGTRFLERVLRVEPGSELFNAGIGIATVVIALGAYDFILKQRKKPGG